MDQIKGGLKNVGLSYEAERQLKREKSRADHNGFRPDDLIMNENRGEPFTGSGKRQVSMASSMGMGKDKIAADHRSDGLITDQSLTLDHHLDRMDEHGGFCKNTEMGKYKQGNVLDNRPGFKVNSNEPGK